jgi:hypothetical protein
MKWPRYCEMLLGLWLLVSPWFLNYGGAASPGVINLAAATGILVLDVLSLRFYKGYAYLAVLGIAIALLAHGYFVMPPEAAGTQNNIITALLLLMFAILPTEATLPPLSWREFHKNKRR